MINNTDYKIQFIYALLLSIPVDDKFRIQHQHIYAAFCDEISKRANVDRESTQNLFEFMTKNM